MEERSALEQHPELAQLWTLHFAGRMALRSLEAAPRVEPAWLLGPVTGQLREATTGLLAAIERYTDVVQLPSVERLLVSIPDSWSPEQADTVLKALEDVAERVARTRRGGRAARSG